MVAMPVNEFRTEQRPSQPRTPARRRFEWRITATLGFRVCFGVIHRLSLNLAAHPRNACRAQSAVDRKFGPGHERRLIRGEG